MLQNNRGFTLFTALVSFILILLAALLVNTMISAERNTTDVIGEIEFQQKMQSIADVSRADGLQVVNLGIRQAIERHLNQNVYTYRSNLSSWDDVTKDFELFYFGNNGSILAGQIATHLTNIISSGPRTLEGFKVEMVGGSKDELEDAIQQTIEQSRLTASSGVLQVIQCNDSILPKDCIGTFYVNLDFSAIPDSAYEKLPQIKVTHLATGRTILEPVIARGTFRIYVPNRVFKALKYARDVSQTAFFNPTIKAEIAKLGLGMCDNSYCHYRNDPSTVPSSRSDDEKICPSDNPPTNLEKVMPKNVPVECSSFMVSSGVAGCSSTADIFSSYTPYDSFSRGTVIDNILREIIASQIVDVDQQDTSDFKILSDQAVVTSSTASIKTKNILFSGSSIGDAYCTVVTNSKIELKFQDSNIDYIVVDSLQPLTFTIRAVDEYGHDFVQENCKTICEDDSGSLLPDISFDVCPGRSACEP